MSYSFSKKNPWSHKIDYDKEIANDLRYIAYWENIIANEWFLPAQYVGTPVASSMTLMDLFMMDRPKAHAAGITDEELEAFAHVADYTAEGLVLYGFDPEKELPKGWFSLGEACAKKVHELSPFASQVLRTPEEAKKILKLEKGHLARHRRNQKKFG